MGEGTIKNRRNKVLPLFRLFQKVIHWFTWMEILKTAIELVGEGQDFGGTGALSIAFNLFLDPAETVLLPSIIWRNYKLIAKKAGVKSDTYQLFNSEGKFNITNLCSKIEEYSLNQKNILVVLNDPCQNPTGYCLSDEEHLKLIKKFFKKH